MESNNNNNNDNNNKNDMYEKFESLFVITYMDEENDTIEMHNCADVKDAIEAYELKKNSYLELSVIVKPQSNKTTQQQQQQQIRNKNNSSDNNNMNQPQNEIQRQICNDNNNSTKQKNENINLNENSEISNNQHTQHININDNINNALPIDVLQRMTQNRGNINIKTNTGVFVDNDGHQFFGCCAAVNFGETIAIKIAEPFGKGLCVAFLSIFFFFFFTNLNSP